MLRRVLRRTPQAAAAASWVPERGGKFSKKTSWQLLVSVTIAAITKHSEEREKAKSSACRSSNSSISMECFFFLNDFMLRYFRSFPGPCMKSPDKRHCTNSPFASNRDCAPARAAATVAPGAGSAVGAGAATAGLYVCPAPQRAGDL